MDTDVRKQSEVETEGYHWWLPRCDTEQADNINAWLIINVDDGLDRVGVFMRVNEHPAKLFSIYTAPT